MSVTKFPQEQNMKGLSRRRDALASSQWLMMTILNALPAATLLQTLNIWYRNITRSPEGIP
jgi:hypothetical protein